MVTIETSSGTHIDLVDNKDEVISEYYIFMKDVERIKRRCAELGVDKVTKQIARLLIREGLIQKKGV